MPTLTRGGGRVVSDKPVYVRGYMLWREHSGGRAAAALLPHCWTLAVSWCQELGRISLATRYYVCSSVYRQL